MRRKLQVKFSPNTPPAVRAVVLQKLKAYHDQITIIDDRLINKKLRPAAILTCTYQSTAEKKTLNFTLEAPQALKMNWSSLSIKTTVAPPNRRAPKPQKVKQRCLMTAIVLQKLAKQLPPLTFSPDSASQAYCNTLNAVLTSSPQAQSYL